MSPFLVAKATAIACAALIAAGCGGGQSNSSGTVPAAVAKKTVKALDSPLIFTIAGSEVTVAISGQQGPPTGELPAQMVCADLDSNGFTNRNEASMTWKKGATSASVTLPKSAADQDLCAISFTTLNKQAVAFLSAAAKKQYLADAQSAK